MADVFVSIIIVTFNNEKDIGACLEALRQQSYRNFEVLVVDNCSQDATVQVVRGFAEVRLIVAERNGGFTGGNIQGLGQTKSEYVVLLNPDTVVAPAWLEELVRGMQSDEGVGMCASQLLVEESGLVDSAGDGCSITGRGRKYHEGEAPVQGENRLVFGACGGAVMIRRKLIEDIGFLDDDFFLIHEDTDLNFRAQLAGWKCVFVPKAVVRHKVGGSIGRMTNLSVYHAVRNTRFVLLKNMPGWLVVKHFHLHVMQELGAFFFYCLEQKKWAAYWRANWDLLVYLPRMIKKRREIRQLKRITNKELEQRLISVSVAGLIKVKWQKGRPEA